VSPLKNRLRTLTSQRDVAQRISRSAAQAAPEDVPSHDWDLMSRILLGEEAPSSDAKRRDDSETGVFFPDRQNKREEGTNVFNLVTTTSAFMSGGGPLT
jgi:hypothetical protein